MRKFAKAGGWIWSLFSLGGRGEEKGQKGGELFQYKEGTPTLISGNEDRGCCPEGVRMEVKLGTCETFVGQWVRGVSLTLPTHAACVQESALLFAFKDRWEHSDFIFNYLPAECSSTGVLCFMFELNLFWIQLSLGYWCKVEVSGSCYSN